MCLDNSAQSTADGNKIQIWGCNGTVAQKWTFVEAGTTLRVQGKCLDITGGGTANGTKVQLYSCNGTGAQVWLPRNGGYYNPASNRCLDNPAHSTTPGTQARSGTATAQTHRSGGWARPRPRSPAVATPRTWRQLRRSTGSSTAGRGASGCAPAR